MRRLTKSLISITLFSALLSACGGGSNYDFTETEEPAISALPHGPIFDPAGADIPQTNDLLFNGTTDGTLNIPNPDANPVIAAINQLDGFSTSNPIIAKFGMSLDPASLIVGETIRIFEITKAGAAITAAGREVTAAEIIIKVLGDDANTLALIPFPPLKESTSYEVVLTNGIKDTEGKIAIAPSAYSLARSTEDLTGGDFEALEPIRQHVNNMELIAASKGVDTAKIVLTWSFTTQSITPVLKQVAADAVAGNITMVQTAFNTSHLQPAGIDYEGLAFAGSADVHVGTLDVPYYLEAPSAQNPTAILTGHWKGPNGTALTRFNTKPTKNTTLAIPVMMTTPNASSGKVMPSTGWPIVMYQHGITRVRTDMLIYADNMANAGFAVIAIDLPLHGVTDTNNPFHTDKEQTFGVDFVDNTTSAPGPDGDIDPSGTHFINLSSPLTSRDNTRQGVSNLLVLRKALASIPNIDASKASLVAHSLGGIIGVPYLGVETTPIPSALITTGASISTILKESANFGPPIKTALEANGITGEAYEQFLLGTQWIVDSSDPINFASAALAVHPIYMTEVIGDGGVHVADTTVPNSSTEILAALLGAQPATQTNNAIAIGSSKIVRFIQGDHSSILDPTDDAPVGTTYINVFREMHTQLASFINSNGTNVVITDQDIIKK